MLLFVQALYDGSVEYEDGTPNTASQAAKVHFFPHHSDAALLIGCLTYQRLVLPGCVYISCLVRRA
jgi:hypothetical protein